MIGSSIVIFGIVFGSYVKVTCILPSVNSDCNSDELGKRYQKIVIHILINLIHLLW